jgi:hypothetical protein
MMSKIGDLSMLIDEEVAEIIATSSSNQTSDTVVTRVGGKAFVRVAKINNAKVVTAENNGIEVLGVATLISVAELVKAVKNRFRTPGENIFPQIVDDYLYKNQREALVRLVGFDTAQVTNDLANLARLVQIPSDLEKMALVRSIKPLALVDEYTIDGKGLSGNILGSFDLPVAVMTDGGVEFEFGGASNVVSNPQRAEQSMGISMSHIMMLVERVENNTVQAVGGLKNVNLGNAMAVLSFALIIIGMVSLIERKLFLFVVFLLIGIAMALFKFVPSGWNRELFGTPELRVYGNSYTVFRFYGDRA